MQLGMLSTLFRNFLCRKKQKIPRPERKQGEQNKEKPTS